MQTWPRLIMKAKDGHEQAMACAAPNPDLRRLERPRASARQYYFVDPYDLIRFVKLVKQDGLYVHPHIGPYVHTEWNLDTGYGDALQSCCYAILLRCSMDCLY
jgi:hypothetical protein